MIGPLHTVKETELVFRTSGTTIYRLMTADGLDGITTNGCVTTLHCQARRTVGRPPSRRVERGFHAHFPA